MPVSRPAHNQQQRAPTTTGSEAEALLRARADGLVDATDDDHVMDETDDHNGVAVAAIAAHRNNGTGTTDTHDGTDPAAHAPPIFIDPMMGIPLAIFVEKDVGDRDVLVQLIEVDPFARCFSISAPTDLYPLLRDRRHTAERSLRGTVVYPIFLVRFPRL
jgi:hypothetical protein